MAGMTFKPKVSPHLYEVDFLSALFYPTNDPDYPIVLGPKPGRILARLGWCVRKLPPKETAYSRMRSVALGLKQGTSHIPIIKELIDALLRITLGTRPGDLPRDKRYVVMGCKEREPSTRADVFLCLRYDITATELYDIKTTIGSISELPFALPAWMADAVCARDL